MSNQAQYAPGLLGKLESWMGQVNRLAVSLAGISLLLMAIIGAADVVGSGFGVPIVGAYELIETLMVITIFLSVSAAQQQGAHINVELIKSRLGSRGQAVLTLFGLLFSGALFALVAYYGWIGTLKSLGSGEIRQGQLGFPVWPARLALAAGASLMVLQCLVQTLTGLRQLVTGEARLVAPTTVSH